MNRADTFEPRLRFHFLGSSEVLVDRERAHLETAKTRALLVYLASNPAPQSRHTLMGLLWGELPETNGRRNLRRALWNLRRQLEVDGAPPPILADRETLCFNRETAYASDVETFEAACVGLHPPSKTGPSDTVLDLLAPDIDLYQGEFLEGLFVSGALAFEEWLLAERQRLHALAIRAFRTLVQAYAGQDRTEDALRCARRLLALEPWLEDGHRWLMRLLARSGRRAEALAQYETCQRLLAEELGVEPSRETDTLYERIRTGAFQLPVSNLPAATTPFVGRARELAEVAGLLAGADCRLLTVTGLGGSGKTRLAREAAAHQLARLSHRVHYAHLGAVTAPDRIAAALIQSLGLPLHGAAEPRSILLAYLRDRRMLLVLDGFEHLLTGAPLLTEILQTAPEIKILVTSRENLNLRAEWVYALKGLACPPRGETGDPAAFDAAALFLQTARRVDLGFQVGRGQAPHLVEICNLVAGLPLAIELAAAWVRGMSLAEIAAEINRHLDFLADTMRDRPERHRSVRAVFDHTWLLLSEGEQDAFRYLSVFRGSFGPREARQVSGASAPTLSALVSKSLLGRTPSGRYQLHDLLRHYARQQLEQLPGQRTHLRKRHGQVYAAVVAQYRSDSESTPHHQMVRSMTADLENIRAAWQWAVQERDLAAIEAMCRPLTDYHQLTSAFRDGDALFRDSLETLGGPLDGQAPGTALDRLAWELLSVQAMFALYLGRLPEARASFERCLPVFEYLAVRDRVAHCQFFLAEIARFGGDQANAGELYQKSLDNYQALGDHPSMGFCLNGLGLVAAAQGEPRLARDHLSASLETFARTGHEMGQAIAGINLANLLLSLNEYESAKAILDESIQLCDRLGHRWGLATCVRSLGDIAQLEGRPTEAKTHYQESQRLLQDIGQRQAAAGSSIKLAGVSIDLVQYAEARQHLRQALTTAIELQDQAQMAEAAVTLASLLDREGDPQSALSLALQAERYPSAAPAVQERARILAAELEQGLSRDTYLRLRKLGVDGTLEDTLAASVLLLEG